MYPAEWCGVCYDACGELNRVMSFEFDQLFQCNMTCGGMLYSNVTDLDTKTILQVEHCIEFECNNVYNDLSDHGMNIYNYFFECTASDSACFECDEILTNSNNASAYPS